MTFNPQKKSVHLEFIKKIQASNFRYLGDRNRMPFYYYIQALISKNSEDKAVVVRGRLINIAISQVMLFLIFVVSSKYISGLGSFTLTVITAITLFLPKLPYIQPEILFYPLGFFAFLFYVKTIKSNRIFDGVMVGVLTSLTYLTKATVLLGFELYIVFQAINFIGKTLGANLANQNSSKRAVFKENVKNIVFPTLASILVFMIILLPYLTENKRMYNRYFYNYATSTVFWYESFGELLINERGVQDTDILSADVSNDKSSNMVSYLKGHSLNEIVSRITSGFLLILVVLTKSNASISFSFLLLYMLFFPYFILSSSDVRFFLKRNVEVAIFVFLYFVTYLLAFSWYALIDPGPRFILSLYIPLMFTLLWTIEKVEDKTSGIRTSSLLHLLSLAILIFSFIPIIFPSFLNESFAS